MCVYWVSNLHESGSLGVDLEMFTGRKQVLIGTFLPGSAFKESEDRILAPSSRAKVLL